MCKNFTSPFNMVTALASEESGPGFSPGWGHWVEFLGKTLNS